MTEKMLTVDKTNIKQLMILTYIPSLHLFLFLRSVSEILENTTAFK